MWAPAAKPSLSASWEVEPNPGSCPEAAQELYMAQELPCFHPFGVSRCHPQPLVWRRQISHYSGFVFPFGRDYGDPNEAGLGVGRRWDR